MKGEKYAVAAKRLNECAGIHGMIAGHAADMYFTKRNDEVSEEELLYIHECKTGKLLLAPVVIASILSNNKDYLPLETFGKLLGLLFQMTDDILDVTGDFKKLGKSVGKDAADDKLTCVRLYGLEGARIHAETCAKDCKAILEGVNGDVTFLKELVDYVLQRTN